MTGYVESLTDPSYKGQILTFTYPLIGNYGVPSSKFWESEKIHAAGVVTGWVSRDPSHWDKETAFSEWLKLQGIPLITGLDTRALTKHLRKQGVVPAAISMGKAPLQFVDPNRSNLVKQVSTTKTKVYGTKGKRVILVDCGTKENIIRSLLKFPITIRRVPFDYDYSSEEYDGVFLSNGPGNPALCKETVRILKKSLLVKKPVMGICLGAQLLALAIGGRTFKLKYGHRGQNHPCIDLELKKCILTSQNHGYAIDEKSLPRDWTVLFRSLNDHSVEGIQHKKHPFFAVQFHPENHPGPTDAAYLFEKFYRSMQ